MKVTKSGEKATKVRGYKRIWLLESHDRMQIVELRPGTVIEDLDTSVHVPYVPGIDNLTYLTHATAENFPRSSGAEFPGWCVTVGRDAYGPSRTKSDALRVMRRQMKWRTNHWDEPATDEETTVSTTPYITIGSGKDTVHTAECATVRKIKAGAVHGAAVTQDDAKLSLKLSTYRHCGHCARIEANAPLRVGELVEIHSADADLNGRDGNVVSTTGPRTHPIGVESHAWDGIKWFTAKQAKRCPA